jgi:hypothetical protein
LKSRTGLLVELDLDPVRDFVGLVDSDTVSLDPFSGSRYRNQGVYVPSSTAIIIVGAHLFCIISHTVIVSLFLSLVPSN